MKLLTPLATSLMNLAVIRSGAAETLPKTPSQCDECMNKGGYWCDSKKIDYTGCYLHTSDCPFKGINDCAVSRPSQCTKDPGRAFNCFKTCESCLRNAREMFEPAWCRKPGKGESKCMYRGDKRLCAGALITEEDQCAMAGLDSCPACLNAGNQWCKRAGITGRCTDLGAHCDAKCEEIVDNPAKCPVATGDEAEEEKFETKKARLQELITKEQQRLQRLLQKVEEL